ncbi:hypothetical protein B9Z19DRAFT_1092998 [Tuber borchii]|uniref:Uncharacterized protein n=1 Tax=Tuber borchii TaxID=42251 RepID=A0A2T6ZG15_TUBBO|nr:hypothetical protein B9Z19DRAFT_1092998 [Tuber borchii]
MGFSKCQAPLLSHSSHAHRARPRSLFALTRLQPVKISLANMLHQKKTPDLAWTPCIDSLPNDYPSVVLESGYRESDAQLMRDSLAWLQGTDGAVKVVVLCKTLPPDTDNKIRATLSICRRMGNGQIIRDEWSVFPIPDNSRPDPYITIDEFFSGSVPARLDQWARLALSLQRLRSVLGGIIQRCGHLTA